MLDSHPEINADKEIHWNRDGIKKAAALLTRSYKNAVKKGNRYLNKEPSSLTVKGLRILERLMEDENYYYIHIKRHPYDTLISYAKTKWDIEYVGSTVAASFQGNARNFIEGYRYLRKNVPANYYEVSYESLVEEPEETLVEVCDFLNIDFDDAMLKHHKKKHVVADHYSDRQAVKPIFKGSISQYRRFLSGTEWRPDEKTIKLCNRMCKLLKYKPVKST
jgi:hypothetical protein